jgi:iron complex outermembrane recepter protein
MTTRPRFARISTLAVGLCAVLALSQTGFAQAPCGSKPASSTDLTTMKLEDLMNIEITSVSKKEQKVSQVAASVFVITQEDVQHSGATNIPDLLRMVPGVDVAQINANTWAISARGFNSEYANKLLVLIDGRPIYTATVGGVNWDTVDVPLEDIERIEVIRGPGGTIWGANAVNGVINIITKKSSDTPGGLVSGGGGTQQQAFSTLQYGGTLGSSSSYRIFSKYTDVNQSPNLNGQDAHDDWHLLHGGFRLDWQPCSKDRWMVEGDLYTGSEGANIVHTVVNPPEQFSVVRLVDLSGGALLGHWDHVFSERSDSSLQISFDNDERNGPENYQRRHTFDLDFQHHFVLSPRHDLIWGAEFRTSPDHTIGSSDESWIPADRTFNLFSAFVQDEITLKPDRLFLTLGSKLENNSFSPTVVEPEVRLAWTPGSRRTVWGSVSTAYRAPNRSDQNVNAAVGVLPGPIELLVLGNPKLQPERVIALESGYRSRLARRLSFDLSAFLNVYSGLETLGFGTPYLQPGAVPPLMIQPYVFNNGSDGHTGGAEVSASWKVNNRWTLSPGYSHIEIAVTLPAHAISDAQGEDPPNTADLRSHFDLGHGLDWDAAVYFLDNPPTQFVASNTRADTQLTWRIGERSQFSIVGQNLLRDHHLEFEDVSQIVKSTLVKRGLFARLQWWF